MKLGKVLTYKDTDEAKKLIGKKVVASDFYASICNDDTACDCVHDTLKAVHADKVCPFECITFYGTQFIREILPDETYKPRYEPYDLSDKKVRDSLREGGMWARGLETSIRSTASTNLDVRMAAGKSPRIIQPRISSRVSLGSTARRAEGGWTRRWGYQS